MRRLPFRKAGPFILALTCLYLALPSNATASSAKIIYTFAGGADGASPQSDLIADSAGHLYGTTFGGGTSGYGTVFELIRTKDGWQHQVLYSFAGPPNDGDGPAAGVVFDSTGNLYGSTLGSGNTCGCGMVFKLAPNPHGGWTESVLYNFTGGNGNGDGAGPNTDLVFDSKGNLFGTTLSGGTFYKGGCDYGCGTVFRLAPNQDGTWTESVVHAFAGPPHHDGSNPSSAIALDADGNIYGTTEYGGGPVPYPCQGGIGSGGGCGAVYKLTPDSNGGWTETLPYTFHLFQGTAKNPSGGFLFGDDGQIFGASTYGGDRDGAVFQLEQTKKGWEQTVLYRFYGNPDGVNPVGRLAKGPNGSLFGATALGGMNAGQYYGTVFEIVPVKGGWRERVLFNANSTACSPMAGPTVDSQGHVYGTLADGHNCGNFGAVYEIIP